MYRLKDFTLSSFTPIIKKRSIDQTQELTGLRSDNLSERKSRNIFSQRNLKKSKKINMKFN